MTAAELIQEGQSTLHRPQFFEPLLYYSTEYPIGSYAVTVSQKHRQTNEIG